MKKALATRGGVVRNQDGFEVFYGLGNKQAAPKTSRARDPQRDGFDVFYGIQNKDRTKIDAHGTIAEEQQFLRQSPVQRSRTLTGNEAAQLETQLSSRLGAPGQTMASATNSGSRFVPVGRSVSDGHVYQYMQNFVPADRRPPDISIVCAADETVGMGDGQEHVQLGGSPQIVHRETEALIPEQQGTPMQPQPPLPSQNADGASSSSAAKIPKSLEVFSMSGRPQQQTLLPTGVTSFSVATPTASYVPAASTGEPACSTGAGGGAPLQQRPAAAAASEVPALAKRQN